ncbi:MAG: DUF4292 domain-containing protein [Deltaproteobacteria bacterium]|nr:DUF4292 domain-containing protein [Deltaproteobacteria bacterium]
MMQTARCLRHGILPLFGITALGFILSGCAAHKPSVPLAFYDSPEAALRALAATTPGKQVFTSTAKIEINHHGNRYPLRGAVMMKKPAFLRVESIPLMGPPDLYLSVAEGELRVFLPGKNAFYTGRATPRNISRFIPAFLPAADMISLLMGVPPEGAEEMHPSNGDREEDHYRVDQYKSGRRMRSLWIDPVGGRLTRFRRFRENGSIIYTADFADHVRIGDGFLPQQVTIRVEEMAVLNIRHADLRQFEADPESFPLPVPEGITPILLDP